MMASASASVSGSWSWADSGLMAPANATIASVPVSLRKIVIVAPHMNLSSAARTASSSCCDEAPLHPMAPIVASPLWIGSAPWNG